MRHVKFRSASAGSGRTVTGRLWFAAPMLVALAIPMAQGRSPDGDLKDVPIDELKTDYLSCNGAAISGRLNAGGITECSVVYEELKRRAFGGDFAKLLDWSKAHPSVQDGEESLGTREAWPDAGRL
jgi:hypothetical protein